MFCWSVPLRCRMFQMLWLDYSQRGAWSGRRWFESDKDQMQTIHLESRMFLPFGRELEISDGCTNNSQSHQNIWWCGGNKCRTKRGHCKLYSKERHIGSLRDRLWKITGHHCCSSYYLVYAVCKGGSLGNTWVLPRAKMMLVPMNFFSSGRICSGGFFILTEQTCIIFAACFILRGLEKHIDFLRFMFLVGIICPLMQEHFLWPLLKCKLPLCG